MPFTATFTRSCRLLAQSVADERQVAGDAADVFDVACPAAVPGTLTTRTDADTGVLTVAAGHGVTTADLLDLYFADGTRRGMTVSAVTATTVAVDAGGGDALPAADAAVAAARVVTQALLLAGGDALAVAADAPAGPAQVVFRTAAGEALAVALPEANPAYFWDGLGANPLAGAAVTAVRVSCGAAAGGTVRGTVLLS